MTTEGTTKPRSKRGELSTVASVLEAHDVGRTHSDLSRDMRDALSRGGDIARDEGTATTKITVTITMVTAANGRTEVKVSGEVKAPRPSHPAAVLYAADGGTLTERDPKQPVLPFRKPARDAAFEDDNGNDDEGKN